MDQELAHAYRVATMGQLTASIAHEANQPIAAAIIGAETVQRRLAREPPDLEKAKLAVQLQQVMLNLIINAVEAMSQMSEGSRELLISTGTEPSGILVAVRDSGPGLTKVGLERVFEAFYTGKPGGLGMGLSICRSIVEAHGGRLWAAPNESRGAIFCFTVPSGQRQDRF